MKKHEAEKSAETEASASKPPEDREGAAAPKGATPSRSMVAAVSTNNYAEVLLAHHDRGGAITEQYRALRNHLLAHYADRRFATLIASAEPGEGKTVTCLNLGIALAERIERTTIVVDCDLRKGEMAKYLNIDKSPGVADLLRSAAALDDVVRPTVYRNLFVIPAGEAKRQEVGELLGRPELHEIASELRRKYDYVLFDTPPINRAADAGMLGPAVDGAELVVRMNKTDRESVNRAIRLFHANNVTVSGLVLTHQRFFIPNYLYRYA